MGSGEYNGLFAFSKCIHAVSLFCSVRLPYQAPFRQKSTGMIRQGRKGSVTGWRRRGGKGKIWHIGNMIT